jgi:hypothetical protein
MVQQKDSFGQNEPTFTEDPLTGNLRDPVGGDIGSTSDRHNFLNEKIQAQFRIFESQIQFIGEPFAGLFADGDFSVPLQVTDGDGDLITFSEVAKVQVNITGGTATGKKLKLSDGSLIGAVDASIDVPLTDGAATVLVVTTSTGTVDLSLTDSDSSGLSVIDTATLTLS